MADDPILFQYLLRLGDSPLILAQRLGAWVGKGPAIEEDIALTNVGLDLLGQARLWLSYAGEVEARFTGAGRSEDQLAFTRDGADFRNLLLVEQPNGNYADTTARQFLFDTWHLLALRALTQSQDARVAEIAAKGVKEATYHVERSGDWVIRLGDGTPESHDRMQAAIDDLWMYTGEMFAADATELALQAARDRRRCPRARNAVAPACRRRVRRGDADRTRGCVDAGRGRARGQARRAHRASWPSARRNAVPAAGLSRSAMVTPEQRAIMATAAAAAPRPSLGSIWAALDAVPDPEIPVLSVLELGIVRAVEWCVTEPDTLIVRVTPTYSGCPATELIVSGIREALAALGIAHVRLEMQLAPAWTTDWMGPEARQKLRAYGIAPPTHGDPVVGVSRIDVTGISRTRRAPAVVSCPRCGSAQTELVAQFGSTACKAQYRCRDCLEPFDYFKPH